MEEEKEIQLELYKVLNKRTDEEIKEFYRLNEVFLGIHSGLLGLLIYKTLGSQSYSLFFVFVIVIFGFVLSILWLRSNVVHHNWKEWWIEHIKRTENHLSIDVWKSTKVLKDIKLGRIFDNFSYLIFLFQIVWLSFLVYFIYQHTFSLEISRTTALVGLYIILYHIYIFDRSKKIKKTIKDGLDCYYKKSKDKDASEFCTKLLKKSQKIN